HQFFTDLGFHGGLFAAGDCGDDNSTDSNAVATHFELLTGRDVQTGLPTSIVVVPLDASNHVVRNYTGTVHLTSSDADGTLPDDYTFQARDHGRHVFQVTFATTGSQTVTATDTATASITGAVTAN